MASEKTKKILIAFLSLAFLLCAALAFALWMPAGTASAEAADHNGHTTEDGWQELTADDRLLSEGNYALLDDVVLTNNIMITGNVTLCLNGYKLTGNGDGSVINVIAGANFTLCDCNTTTEHKYNVNEATGLYEFTADGENTLTGGVVTGGDAGSGGGVYVAGGTFTMEGGAIAGNTATSTGGGVYVAGGTFTMSGGTTAGNTATDGGGGVYAAEGARFEMSGTAAISGNTATDGGGVCVGTCRIHDE